MADVRSAISCDDPAELLEIASEVIGSIEREASRSGVHQAALRRETLAALVGADRVETAALLGAFGALLDDELHRSIATAASERRRDELPEWILELGAPEIWGAGVECLAGGHVRLGVSLLVGDHWLGATLYVGRDDGPIIASLTRLGERDDAPAPASQGAGSMRCRDFVRSELEHLLEFDRRHPGCSGNAWPAHRAVTGWLVRCLEPQL